MSAISARVEGPRTRRRVRRHRQNEDSFARLTCFRTSPAGRLFPRSDALSCSGLSFFARIRSALFLYNSISLKKNDRLPAKATSFGEKSIYAGNATDGPFQGCPDQSCAQQICLYRA